MIRSNIENRTVIPKEFLSKPGNLIYFSLGSWLFCEIKFLNRLVSILAKLKNNHFKIPRHEEVNFSENVWGERYLNQLQILETVDLVIIHGGHNSVIECCHFGKPMIIMPLFIDEHDNAQRICEKVLSINLIHTQ